MSASRLPCGPALRRAALSFATAAVVLASAGPAVAADPKMVFDDQLSVTPVCFTTNAPENDPQPSAIFGRRYTDGPVNPLTPAIVLVHGIASSTETWDFSPDWSVARNLASAGYVVYAYDRLGYARSPYDRPPPSGTTITSAVQRQVLHDVVNGVKSGGYETTTGPDCKTGTKAPGTVRNRSVVILGHSAGGWVTAGYPGEFNDVAAMIQTSIAATTSQAEGEDDVGRSEGGGFTPNEQRPDYFEFFQERSQCEAFNLVKTNVVQYVVDVACQPPFLLSPFGEINGLPMTLADNDRFVSRIGPGTPVLLAAGDRDSTAPPAELRGEFNFYKENCDCPVDLHFVKDTGHLYHAHRSLDEFLAFIVDWLSSQGLPPAPRSVPVSSGPGAAPGATGSPQATPVAPGTQGSPGATPARRSARAFRVRVSPGRDRRAPFRFRTTGRLELFSGMRPETFCRGGRVSVQVKAGRRTVSTRRTRLRPDCTFASSVTFTAPSRLSSSGRLRFQVRFLGNGTLNRRRAADRTVRAGG